jgi:hypothetical protein
MEAKTFRTASWDVTYRSLQDLKAMHKCNGSPQELMDGGGLTWCATQRKKHQWVGKNVE